MKMQDADHAQGGPVGSNRRRLPSASAWRVWGRKAASAAKGQADALLGAEARRSQTPRPRLLGQSTLSRGRWPTPGRRRSAVLRPRYRTDSRASQAISREKPRPTCARRAADGATKPCIVRGRGPCTGIRAESLLQGERRRRDRETLLDHTNSPSSPTDFGGRQSTNTEETMPKDSLSRDQNEYGHSRARATMGFPGSAEGRAEPHERRVGTGPTHRFERMAGAPRQRGDSTIHPRR